MTALLADALAVYRLWRLAAHDTILDGPRDRLRTRAFARATNRGRHQIPTAVALVDCPWCLGFWLAVVAVTIRARAPRVWLVVRDVCATSALVGLIATVEDHAHRT
jgi:hypothetical protein